MWVAATTHDYGIKFYPYIGKDASCDNKLGLGGSVVMSLSSKLPSVHDSNYHRPIDNFFTSPRLLRELKMKKMAGAGTVRVNRTEKVPLNAVEEMKTKSRGSHVAAVDAKSNVTPAQWKDNKVVTVASIQHCMDNNQYGKLSVTSKTKMGGYILINQVAELLIN